MQVGDIKSTLANNKLLYDLTNFLLRISYKEGVKNFTDWYKGFYK